MLVDALQCKQSKTIATDLGFINVKPDDWVVCGEGGETYIVDDEYFQKSFVLARKVLHSSILEPNDAQCAAPTASVPARLASSRSCFSRNRTSGAVRFARGRRAKISQLSNTSKPLKETSD
jgi:hypothetical protein